MATFQSSFKLKLIYVFRINDETHKGCLKVGETTFKDSANPLALQNNCKELNAAAKERINQYTSTAGIQYELLHTELTLSIKQGELWSFNDGEVHKVLTRSGIKKKTFETKNKANEWFITDLETVKKAIKAAKEGRKSLFASEISTDLDPIVFRPEQRDAIERTKKRFKTNNQYLWNAKMRFGKTLSALQVVKEMELDRTLILTHRPVVDAGWFEDFGKIFYDRPDYQYGSRTKGEQFQMLEQMHRRGIHYVYFVSMQDLRGSELVGGNFDKNNEIFSTNWDLLIVDEAHEGTKTELGQAVLNELQKECTKILQMSGTPFNLFDDFNQEEIYTWDYVMEQRAKQEWENTHWGETNPYACLPKVNIYTYDLSLELKSYQDDEHAFNFAEFFRVDNHGKFLHEEDIDNFLDLLASNSAQNYPYSKLEWRQNFRHSLWTVPSVAAAKALSIKIRKHKVLGIFQVVNVAGDGDTDADYESNNALEMVQEAIGPHPEETFTITLSRGRLTTGVSVPAWTAVFMLHGSAKTSAQNYMQTIFRAQTPAIINGRQKQECFVFDFAPDRTLQVLAETAKVSSKAGKTSESDRQILGEFLNFCPVISFHGSQMSPIDVPSMMQQLKRVYVERVVSNGFEDHYLYNDKLMRLDNIELEKFANLREIIGKTKAMKHSNEVDINNQGFTNEEYEEKVKLEKKPKKQLTAEEAKRLEELKKKKTQRDTAISILRGISIRMPMIIYGAELTNEEEEINIDNFTELVDDLSWEEFMPKKVTKELFNEFKQYYDEDIFAAAGKRIRDLARRADKMDIEDRIEQITSIFSSFRNPDKETVLTPWRVVNLHLGDTLGGWNFLTADRTNTESIPHYRDQGEVSQSVFSPESLILEINSKSGLYPLYMAYSLYRNRIEDEKMKWMITETAEEEKKQYHLRIWDEVLRKNLFIVCKTPMSKSITRRTLTGFRNARVNVHFFEDLINQITNKKEQFIKKVSNGKDYWNANSITDMKFNAIVGNPPYQLNDGSGASDDAAMPIYNKFVDISKLLKPLYISLIMPSKWMIGGRGLQSFRQVMKNDHHIKKMIDYEDDSEIFPNTHIDGGICYLLWDLKHNGQVEYTYKPTNFPAFTIKRDLNNESSDYIIRDYRRSTILMKLFRNRMFSEIVSTSRPFGIRKDLFNSPERYPNSNLSETPFANAIKIYGVKGIKGGARRQIGYISRHAITKNFAWAYEYKLFFTTSYSTGAIEFPDIIVGDKFTACTETFLVIGPFKTQEEQMNCLKYTETNFFKVLLFFGKGSMQVTQSVFCYIPLQNFTSHSDIDWNKSVAEIDKDLYDKYGITEEEVHFIENIINPT